MIDLSGSGLTQAQVNTQVALALETYNASKESEIGALNDISVAQAREQDDASLIAYNAANGTDLAVVDTNVDELIVEEQHITAIFPEDTDETVTLAAGTPANTWGAWVEIVDDNSVTLSSKATAVNMHISTIMVEDSSVKDKIYMVEIAYGSAHTVVSRQRYMAQNTKVGTVQQAKVRAEHIPAGETIYYRAKCETASATVQVHLRYHTHS